jgi:hypothetical protein
VAGVDDADDERADAADDDARLARLGAALADGVLVAIPGWVQRQVERVLDAWMEASPGSTVDSAQRDGALASATVAGRQAAEAVGPVLRALLGADVDEQTVTPLQLVRELVRFPAAVLEAAGVPPVVRDPFAEQRFPDDRYGLTPASLAAVDPTLAEPSLTWGAAKALAHRRRHRPPTVH